MAINIPIFTSFNNDGIKKAQGAFAKLQPSLLAVAAGVTAVTGAAVAFGVSAVKAASDFNETVSKTEVVFGAISAQVKDFSRTAARELGISRTAALDAAATFAIFGKSAGLAGKDLANFSTDFVKLAADLASFNNTSVDEAITALGAALRGENEPIRKFGVLLNDAALKAAAMELGIYRGTGALTAQQKVLAAQKVIYEQTGDAQGDFARTSGGLAGQMKILSATVDDVKTNLGRALIPVVQTVVTWFNTHVTPAVERVTAAIGEDGFGAGVKQMIAEFKRAGIDITPILKAITLSTAGFINVLARVAHVGKSVWQTLKGDLIGAAKSLSGAFTEFIDVNKLGAQFDAFAAQVYNAGTRMSYGSYHAKMLAETAKSMGDEIDPNNAGGAGGKTKKFGEALKENLEKRLTDAAKKLEETKKAFTDFAKSISESVAGALNFGDARDAGKETGQGFIAGLRGQVAGVAAYGDRIRKLLAMGLSQTALRQVLDAGQEAGTEIADQLIAGGVSAIEETNKLVEAAQSAANEVGDYAANTFMAAGIKAAQSFYDGLAARLKKLRPNLAKDIDDMVAGINKNLNVNVGGGTTTTGAQINAPKVPAPMANVTPINWATFQSELDKIELRREQNITVNVNGGFGTTAEIATGVVNALRQYNQVNGPIPIAVAV